MREAVQAAINELEMANPKGVSLSAISDQISADQREVTGILKELREDAVILKTGRLYRMNPEYGKKQAASNDAVDELYEGEEKLSMHPALQAIDRLSGDLEELDKHRSTPEKIISDKTLKLEVLARLSLILADDVGEVLNSIAEDLEAV